MDAPLDPCRNIVPKREDRQAPPELDELTLARAQRGIANARRSVVERHQVAVFALLSRRLPGQDKRPLVEDLAQETFLRVFRHLPRFDPGGAARLSTWILRIATNLAIDELRRQRPRVEGGPEPVPSDGRFAADRAVLAAMIEHAVAQLPAEYRAAFVLRHYHELSYQEIADTLGVVPGTVRSRLSRARKCLQAVLRPPAKEADHG